jgi:hypothetical protein
MTDPATPSVEFSFKNDYVEVRYLERFELTAGVSQWLWNEALKLCDAHQCNRILRCGTTPTRHLKNEDAIAVGNRLCRPGLKVANCFASYKPDVITAAFATAALRNGVNIRYFEDEQQGIEWLHGRDV